MNGDMNGDEITRIQAAYQGYQDANLGATRWSPTNEGNHRIGSERAALIKCFLQRHGYLPLQECRILDAGCGSGDVLAGCVAWGAQPHSLFGLELLGGRAAAAQARHPSLAILQGNAAALGFDAASFDLVFFFTVFSSVLDDTMRQAMAAETVRVLKPHGAVVWYDLRIPNPRNANLRPLGRRQVAALFPSLTPHLCTTTVLPPLARRLGKSTAFVYPKLSRVGWLHTHIAGLLIKD
jgi:ubiquinone/menaquinone biosynthesis C-methylase UbiE